MAARPACSKRPTTTFTCGESGGVNTHNYSLTRLGAIGSELGVLACLFDRPWSEPSPNLQKNDQAILLHNAGFLLRISGRSIEALEPMEASLDVFAGTENWTEAAKGAGNLSELMLNLKRFSQRCSDSIATMTDVICALVWREERQGDADQIAYLIKCAGTRRA